LAAVLLLAGGTAYRLLASLIGAEMALQVRLDPPLSTLPMQIGTWAGEDVPLREGVLRIAGNDDYVSRTYRDTETGALVNLFVGYTARPRTMLRHRPSVCYPSAGWTPLTTTDERLLIGTFIPRAAREGAGQGRGAQTALPVRLHEFLRAGIPEQRVVVLNYYVLNGATTIDEHSFWGLSWRDPNRRRDASRYVAQVQIATAVRTTPDAAADLVRRFAADSAPAILPLLPPSANPAPSRPGAAP